MKIKSFTCPQCGSSDFNREKENLVRCTYCRSLYQVPENFFANQGNVIISKGAKVTFGKNAHIIIKGSLEIEEGAEVDILGKITLVEKSDQGTIETARQRLKKIEEG